MNTEIKMFNPDFGGSEPKFAQTKMTISESLEMLARLVMAHSHEKLVKSYLCTISAALFNDKFTAYYLKLDLERVPMASKGQLSLTMQRAVYTYRNKVHTYRVESIVKLIMLPEQNHKPVLKGTNFHVEYSYNGIKRKHGNTINRLAYALE